MSTGLLFYTQQDQLIRVAQAKHELRGLIHARNELARYASMRSDSSLARPKENRDLDDNAKEVEEFANADTDAAPEDIEDALLPTPIDDEHWCKRCYASDACMLYRKVRYNFLPKL